MVKKTVEVEATEELEEKTKEERLVDFTKAVMELQSAIEPFKESLKDLKKSYKENEWLSKEEIADVLRSLRLIQQHKKVSELTEVYQTLVEKMFPHLKEG